MLIWIVTGILGALIWFLFSYSIAANRKIKKMPSSVPPIKSDEAVTTTNKALIIYGTQTGTAEMFAKTMNLEGSLILGGPCNVHDAEVYPVDNLPEEKLVIFIVATYGEGEPTDNMKSFYSWLFDEARYSGELNKVSYTVFGLGDRQYKHFCQMGVDVDTRMSELGAKRIYGLGFGDAGQSIEEDFDSWRKDLWPEVGRCLGITLKARTEAPYVCELKIKYVEGGSSLPYSNNKSVLGPTQRNPSWTKMVENRELLRTNDDRSTRHIVLDITGCYISYEAGDHMGILPRNTSVVVDDYLKLLGVDNTEADKVITLQDKKFKNAFPARVSIRNILTWYLDLCGPPKKSSLRAFAHCCENPDEKSEWLSIMGTDSEARAKYKKIVTQVRNVGGFISHFSSCRVSLALFLEVMPRLTPRYFSIASDQLAHPNQVFLTVAVVKGGVCTNMLAEMKVGDQIPAFVRKSNFHLPLRKKNQPIIMIGPGTGVAPLIGFLHRRKVWKEKKNDLGEALLFFGCRNKLEDFIYEEVMTSALADGVISDLDVAFSRDQAEKIYVQHKIRDKGEKIHDLLNTGMANVYICGDAKHMAKDVESALIDIIQKYGNKTVDEAKKIITMLEKTERLLKDVWSA